jgi:hypothetical protein
VPVKKAGRPVAAMVLGVFVLGALACSLQNREGPEVTCAALSCGKINACREGIIASCADGVTVKYHACSKGDDDLCEQDWQVEGKFKCDEFAPECEGCRPLREGCPLDGGAE